MRGQRHLAEPGPRRLNWRVRHNVGRGGSGSEPAPPAFGKGEGQEMRRGIVTAVAVLAAALAAAAVFGPAVMGQEAVDPDIRIEEAWARPGLSGGTSAVYFTLSHGGNEPLTLVGAESDVAATMELHETV